MADRPIERRRDKRILVLLLTMVMLGTLASPASAKDKTGFLTSEPVAITLTVAGDATAIISSGDQLGDFTFEGLPDGIGMKPGKGHNTVEVYVAHEQTTVPFFGTADFENASVAKLTLSTAAGHEGEVLSAEVVVSSDDGYLRFCSATMLGPDEGFKKYTFVTGEEANDVVPVAGGSPYGSDPSLAPDRQAGYVVALDTTNGKSKPIVGMGRLNHENTIVVPGDWEKQIAVLTTDDTFSGPSAQLYMYLAKNDRDVWKDNGTLWAFRATAKNGDAVDPTDSFNGANDYLDIRPGDDLEGEFIPVPDDIADGTTGDAPQTALEDWSNDNNVFQFLRLEDMDYDKNNPRVVYVADTGRTRVVPDPATGRLIRGPSGTVGQSDNGSVFRFVFNEDDPTVVDSLTVIAQGDDVAHGGFVGFVNPDNMGASANSLMVQEDNDGARIWRYDLGSNWSVVATVNDLDGESSGIVDASKWYGPGSWILDVQAHGSFESQELQPDGTLLKREDGQLILMTIPGS